MKPVQTKVLADGPPHILWQNGQWFKTKRSGIVQGFGPIVVKQLGWYF